MMESDSDVKVREPLKTKEIDNNSTQENSFNIFHGASSMIFTYFV